jgi:integrase
MAEPEGSIKTPYTTVIPSSRVCAGSDYVLKYSRNQACFSCPELPNGSNRIMEKQKQQKSYKKQGNPYKRGDTWTFIYYITDAITGKKVQKRKGGYSSKKEAEEALNETEALILTGHFVEDKKMSVGEYITYWFNDIHKARLQPSTKNGYDVNIKNHIIPHLGAISLTKLTRNDVIRFYNKLLEEGLSPTTIKYIHRVLCKALKEAVLSDLILKNPCASIELPKQKKYHAVILNAEQIKVLLKNCIGSAVEFEVLLALTLGLRRGEVLGLKFDDFDFVNKTVHIQRQVTAVKDTTTKRAKLPGDVTWGLKELKTNESNRVVYVPQAVLDAVQNRKLKVEKDKQKYADKYIDYGLVCCMENGMYESPQTVYERFKKLLKEAGLPDIRFHDLRHSYATMLLDLDVPMKVISKILGHSSINITADIYCDVLEKKKLPAEVVQGTFFNA